MSRCTRKKGVDINILITSSNGEKKNHVTHGSPRTSERNQFRQSTGITSK